MTMVKTHNDFNALAPIKGLTPIQQKLLVVAIHNINDKGTLEVHLSKQEVCKLANINPADQKAYYRLIDQASDKFISNVRAIKKTTTGFEKAPLFDHFDFIDGKDICISVNKRAIPLFNDLKRDFTQFRLEDHNDFRSSYTMIAFRNLMQFKGTGWWTVSLEEFRLKMAVPPSYNMRKISEKILNPIEEELSNYFNDFKIEKVPAPLNGKRGRRPIERLNFYFSTSETRKDVTPTPVWKQDWYQAMSQEERRDFRRYCKLRKIEEDAEKQEKISVLISAGASEMEINMAMQYLDDGNIEGYSMIVDMARKQTGKAGKQKEKKNTPPPEEVPYSDQAMADNLPF